MSAALDQELQKVAAATTLCHLCSLERLERLVAEARRQPKEKPRPKAKSKVAGEH